MASSIQKLQLDDGEFIFVEVDIGNEITIENELSLPDDLPPGAEPTGIVESVYSVLVLTQNIKGMAAIVKNSLKELKPDEWTVEINIGFKGSTSPIPFITKGEREGGIKVSATWKKALES